MSYNPFNNGVYNTTPPTLTNGQMSAVQLDVNGNLKIASIPSGINVIGHIIADSGSTTVVTGTVAVTESGVWVVRTQDGSGNAVSSTNEGSPVTTGLNVHIQNASAIPVTLTSTTITGTVGVTQSTSPWVVSNSGTFAVQATLTAETTKVIGVVRTSDGTGNLLSSTTEGSPATTGLNVHIQNSSPILVSDGVTGNFAVVSAGNSTTATLLASATFTGTTMDLVTLGYTSIQVQSLSNVAGTLQIQFSTDNSNWDHIITGAAAAASSASLATGIHARYARVVYVNGGTNQTSFRLQTLLIPSVVQATVKDLDTGLNGDDNLLCTHSVITGVTTGGGGGYVDVKVNPSGSLVAAVTAADGDVYVRSNAASTFPVTATIAASQTIAVTQATAASLNATVVQGTGTNLHCVTDAGSVTAATLAAETTKVIGTVNQGTSPWVVSNGGTFAVQATLTAETTKVIGTARVIGNAGATLDSTIGAATAPTNALAISSVYQTTIPALTAGQAVAVQCDTTGGVNVNIEGRKKTYSCFASFTPVAGDIALLPGNASTTVRVTRVEVSLSTTGTAALESVQLIKRSAADSAGTSASMTAVPYDSGFSAASSVPLSYTAAPTLGAAVGTIRGVQFFDESATVAGANTWFWTFGERGGASAVVLRGTAQQLCVNLGAVVATQTATVSFEWTEDNS